MEGHTQITDDGEKAALFAKQFASTSNTDNYTDEFKRRKPEDEQNQHLLLNDVPDNEHNRALTIAFSMKELEIAIARAKKWTAPGQDRIQTDFIAHLPDEAKGILLKLYNTIWTAGRIPKLWKNAIVVPMVRNGKDAT